MDPRRRTEAPAPVGPLLATGGADGAGHGAAQDRVRAPLWSARTRVRGSGTRRRKNALRIRSRRAPSNVLVTTLVALAVAAALSFSPSVSAQPRTAKTTGNYEFNDCHFHLTNYVQEGITAQHFLGIMGKRVGRSTLFGIPLQQQWSYRISGDKAPTYYLDSDARLYYYSFTDAQIAMAYKALSKADQARFDPMITGFNPTDMYAADHIRRVLQTFPGVFSGIGEFSIHKEFVSSKVAGD